MTPEDHPRTLPPAEGRQLGRYLLTARLGQGGMGVVFAARDTLLEREVAVKLLPAEVASSPEMLERFLREARAAARLCHPNVVALYDVDQEGETRFLVMELARGESADEALRRRGPLMWEEATRIIADACRGLAAAHVAGLIHRDIKPANLLLVPGVGTKLADFGVAKVLGADALAVTQPGNVVGTPAFMSPEQCRGTPLDGRSDLYSLGATYYNLLTGHVPFTGESAMEVLFAHCDRPVPDPRQARPDLPEGCTGIVRRAMAKRREDRYPDAGAMLADLERLLTSAPPSSPEPSAPCTPATAPPTIVTPNLTVQTGELDLKSTSLSSDLVPRLPIRRRLWGRRTLLAMVLAAVVPGVLVWSLKGKPSPPAEEQQEAEPNAKAPSRVEFVPPPARADAPRWFGGRVTEKGLILLADRRVEAANFSPDGRLLAAAHGDGASDVQIWDTEGGKSTLTRRPRQGGLVRCLAFAPDGKSLACGGDGLEIWRLDGGEDRTLAFPAGTSVSALAFAPDGKLAVGLDPGSSGRMVFLQVWDLPGGLEVASRGEHTGRVTALAFAPGGGVLVSGSSDGTVRVWDPALAGKPRTLAVDMPVRGLALPPNGTQLVVAGGPRDRQGLQFWDRMTWRRVEQWECAGTPHGVAFTLNGSLLAVADGRTLAVADRQSPSLRSAVETQPREILGLAVSPDGLAATIGEDQTLRLWDLRRLVFPTQP